MWRGGACRGTPPPNNFFKSVSEIWGEDVAVDSLTATPDQQLVTNDQEVTKKRAKTNEVLPPDFRLKVIMGSSIDVIICAIYLIFRHDFSVWE